MNRSSRNSHFRILSVMLLMVLLPCYSLSSAIDRTTGGNDGNDVMLLETWKAGAVVSQASVNSYGKEKCFAILPVSDDIFKRMDGRSFKRDCTVRRSELRYLKVLHRNIRGEICLGELVCNKAISEDLLEIFRALYEAGYPIERMVLIDDYDADDERSMNANNTSCFNFRFVGSSKKLSNHSRGLAIDINPLYNPYVRKRKNGSVYVNPAAGRPYAGRNKQFKYKIVRGDICYRLFIKHGFTWGGNWKSLKDYQHFEKVIRK